VVLIVPTLFLDAETTSHIDDHPLFKFTLGWLKGEGFYDLVARIW
jgi:hypothetical protein